MSFSIDVHAHILPEETIRRLARESPQVAPKFVEQPDAGPERVLLGSDYPFVMGNLDCVARVQSLLVPQAVRDAVLGGRARELLFPSTVITGPTRSAGTR